MSLFYNFYLAIELFIKKVLNNQKLRDLKYIYMALGGDNVMKKTSLPCRKRTLLDLKRCCHHQASAGR